MPRHRAGVPAWPASIHRRPARLSRAPYIRLARILEDSTRKLDESGRGVAPTYPVLNPDGCRGAMATPERDRSASRRLIAGGGGTRVSVTFRGALAWRMRALGSHEGRPGGWLRRGGRMFLVLRFGRRVRQPGPRRQSMRKFVDISQRVFCTCGDGGGGGGGVGSDAAECAADIARGAATGAVIGGASGAVGGAALGMTGFAPGVALGATAGAIAGGSGELSPVA